MRVTVLLTPSAGAIPGGATVVVVDVLRATTTLSTALANGAARVIPVASPEQALGMGREDPNVLTCGERDGRKIPGFDLGNSPAEYPAAAVSGRTLVFASSNGSLAMIHARAARRRVLGAFVNASAVLRAVEREDHVCVLCSGKLGAFSLEDTAFAGWLCERLAARGARVVGGSARFARTIGPRDAAEARALVQGSAHGRDLAGMGPEYLHDVELCAELDRLDRAFDF